MRRYLPTCLALAALACFEDPILDGDTQIGDGDSSEEGDGDGDPTGDGDGDPTGDGDGDGDPGDGDGDGDPGDGDGDGDGDPTPCEDMVVSAGIVCFAPGELLATGDVAQDVAAAQLDGDPAWELVVMAVDALYVHDDMGLGEWIDPIGVGGGEFGGVDDILVADVDSDSFDDIVANAPPDGRVMISLGDGNGSLELPNQLMLGSPSERIVVARLKMAPSEFDLMTIRGSGDQDVYAGNGSGSFLDAPFNWAIQASQPSAALAFDVDGDGDEDVFVASSGGPDVGVRLALAKADGSQQGSSLVTPQIQATLALQLGDVDGNGDPDLVTARFGQPIVDVMPGNGSATFDAPLPIALDDSASGLALADVDLDGMADVIVSYDSKPELDIFRSEGDFEFEAGVAVSLPSPGRVLPAPDLDGDSIADLFVVPNMEAIIVVLSEP